MTEQLSLPNFLLVLFQHSIRVQVTSQTQAATPLTVNQTHACPSLSFFSCLSLSLFCVFPVCSLLSFSFSFPPAFSTFLTSSLSSDTEWQPGEQGRHWRRAVVELHPHRQMRHFQGQAPYLF